MRTLRSSLLVLAIAACGGKGAKDASNADGAQPCGGLEGNACQRAAGMVRAANGFGNVRHEYLIDPASAMTTGRCVARTTEGAYEVLPHACAEPKSPATPAASADASKVDFTYVGLAIDHQLVGTDVDLVPWASAGASAAQKKISLVAMAFVRDDDPQFFNASSEVAFDGNACTHGRATHFVGAVKVGGMLAYEMIVRGAELHGSALSFFKARLAAGDKRITQTVVGGLEVEGLEAATATAADPAAATGAVDKPLTFRVKNPVPIAYAVYPLADVCKFSFPAPEVSPELVEFGDVPYGQQGERLLHIVNRANLEVRADFGGQSFTVPPLGNVDWPVRWTPNGSALGCERQEHQETLLFQPTSSAPVTPKSQSVRLTKRVRTGKPLFTRQEHVDTGIHARPDYSEATRQWECPADYVMQSCRTENLQCGEASCTEKGYAVNASPEGNGCKFTCNGPKGIIPGLSSYYCRFDAVMECALRCK